MYKQLFYKFKKFLNLGRYNKPYGIFLLMWPCFWGCAYHYNLTNDFFLKLMLFFIGSAVMRGAGCTLNDIIDRKIDRKVERTKNRPIAEKSIKVSEALFFLFLQLLIGLIIVLQFDIKTIITSFLVIPFIIFYPFVKRFSHFPQVVLGLIYNWGIIVSTINIQGYLDKNIIFLYFSGVFLTIGYDTIYAYQDVKDDIKINVHSLAIITRKKPKIFMSFIYLLSFIFFSSSFEVFNYFTFVFLILVFLHLSIQIFLIDIEKTNMLQKIFVSNIYLGGIMFFGLILGYSNYL